MRKIYVLVAILATFLLANTAFAGNNSCNGVSNCDGDTTIVKDNFSPSSQASANAVGVGVGVGHGGDASSRSRSTAFGGSAEQGQQQGIFDSGNAHVNTRNQNTNVGIQGQLGILDNDVDFGNGSFDPEANSRSNSSAEVGDVSNRQGQDQGQSQYGVNKQGQDQTAVGSVDSHDSVVVEGDDIEYEAPDIPVNSAAPVFAGACSQGLSVQTQSFGGSAGTTNSVCDYVAVAGGFVAAGERDEAIRVLTKAEGAADWRYRFSQFRSVFTLGIF